MGFDSLRLGFAKLFTMHVVPRKGGCGTRTEWLSLDA